MTFNEAVTIIPSGIINTTLVNRAEMVQMALISIKCEVFDDVLFRKQIGEYFNLRVDDWIFGFNLKHGPAI
jgi:hypothetical protein